MLRLQLILTILLFGFPLFLVHSYGSDPIYSSKHHAQKPKIKNIYRATKKRSPQRDERLSLLLDQISLEFLMNKTTQFSRIESRSSFDEGNLIATEFLLNEFSLLGYEPRKECFDEHSIGDICNVVAIKKGEDPNLNTIYLVAHFDSVGHDQAGADDNASGTIGLVEIAKVLKNIKLNHTVVFAAVNAEEIGLKGSRAIVKALKETDQLADIKVALVMDMVGVNMGDRIDLETYEDHKSLGLQFIDQLSNYLDLEARLIIPGWGSDHISFLREGVPSFLSISDTDAGTPCYHRPCDQIETIDPEHYLKMVKANLIMTVLAAELSEANPFILEKNLSY